jgi:uncharacterized protein
MIVLDTGVIYAYYDRDDRQHSAVRELLDAEDVCVLPAPVIPEVDYLIGKRLGQQARSAFLEDVIAGVYTLENVPFALYPRIQELDQRYNQLDLGFVDASVITLAEWLKCSRIATLDHRHFAAVARELQFVLLP